MPITSSMNSNSDYPAGFAATAAFKFFTVASLLLVNVLNGVLAQDTDTACLPASTLTVTSTTTIYVTGTSIPTTTRSTSTTKASTTSKATSTSRLTTSTTTRKSTSSTSKTTSKASTTTTKASTTSAVATSTSTSAPSGWFKPTPGTSFLWSLDVAIPAKPVGKNSLDLSKMQIYDVDLFEATKAQIATYKAAGKKVVCYFSAGTFEDGRDDAASFTKTCYCNRGNACKMEEWDEWWLDLNTPACVTNVQSIMQKRIELAKSKGCDAVEPDNTDSYLNKPSWKTTVDDQFNYLSFLSTTAHNSGLGIALKNGPDMISKKSEIVKITDFVIIEECQAYDECAAYKPFVDAGKAAFQVEYERSITCSNILPGFFALSYSSYDVNYKNVQGYCPKA